MSWNKRALSLDSTFIAYKKGCSLNVTISVTVFMIYDSNMNICIKTCIQGGVGWVA